MKWKDFQDQTILTSSRVELRLHIFNSFTNSLKISNFTHLYTSILFDTNNQIITLNKHLDEQRFNHHIHQLEGSQIKQAKEGILGIQNSSILTLALK